MTRAPLASLAALLVLATAGPAGAQPSEGAPPPRAAGANDSAKGELRQSGEITGAAPPTADPAAGGREIPGSGKPADPKDRAPHDAGGAPSR